jgi:hypothetical protein
VTPRSVDVYVRRIREKIETDPESPRYLKTVRGAGYRFEVPGLPRNLISRLLSWWMALQQTQMTADDRLKGDELPGREGSLVP